MGKDIVLVTGASRGIGKAIAIQVAKKGYFTLLCCNKNTQKATETKEQIIQAGGEAELISFDVANRDETRGVLENWQEKHGAFYGVVCNAGVCRDGAFPALSAEDWDSVLNINLTGGFYNVLSPLIMPMCRKKRGRIITIASVSGVMGNRGQVNYSASKAGIIGASKALAIELASRNITVNCIAPGVIQTDMIKDAPLDYILPAIPMHRLGEAQEVASLAVFLLSKEAAYITKQVICVDGGLA